MTSVSRRKNEAGLSANDFKLKMNDLQRYRDAISQELPDFNKMRRVFVEICNEHCKNKLLSSSLRSSSGGNRVTFHKNLITKAKDVGGSNSSLNRKPLNKMNQNYQNYKSDR
jgi:hypothetical protein